MQLVAAGDGIAALVFAGFELRGRLGQACVGAMYGLAQLGETRDHIAPFFLQQQHPGIQALQNQLAAAALLGQIAHEQTFFLQQTLVFLQLALLFVEAKLRHLHKRVRFFFLAAYLLPLALQLAQIVHRKRQLHLFQVAGKVLVLLGARGLALQGL